MLMRDRPALYSVEFREELGRARTTMHNLNIDELRRSLQMHLDVKDNRECQIVKSQTIFLGKLNDLEFLEPESR